MQLLKYCVAVIVIFAAEAGRAAPAIYDWTATVTTSSTGSPPRGAQLPVSVTLDRGYPANANTADPEREATYTGGLGTPSGKSPILAITVAGANALGSFDTVHIEKNLAGLSRISIESALPQCCRSVHFVFSTTVRGVVRSVDIPNTLTPADFETRRLAATYTATDRYDGVLR